MEAASQESGQEDCWLPLSSGRGKRSWHQNCENQEGISNGASGSRGWLTVEPSIYNLKPPTCNLGPSTYKLRPQPMTWDP